MTAPGVTAPVARDGEFAVGYRLGYATGYDIGFRHGEQEQAGSWSTAVADARELLRQAHEPDRPDARVASAERYCAARAERLYNDPEAWDSAWRAGAGAAPSDRRMWRSSAELRRSVERRPACR